MDKDALHELGSRIIDTSIAAGAEIADISLGSAQSREIIVRKGKTETVETNDNLSASLRVMIDQKQAWLSLTPRHNFDVNALVERAISMAKVAPVNPYAGLAEATYQEADTPPLLDTIDKSEPSNDELKQRAEAIEAAALDVKGVYLAENAFASHALSQSWLLTSAGFSGFKERSMNAHGVSVIAGDNDDRVIDSASCQRIYMADLEAPASVGVRAAERALSGLKAQKPKSASVVAVFEPRVSAQLIGNLIGAIKGANIARRSSFLLGRIDEIIASDNLTLLDNPHLARGLNSRLFDGEGAASRPITLIDHGRLTTWLLNSESARELGLRTTGHASRGSGIGTATSNLEVIEGTESLNDMISTIDNGVLVTQLLGHGFDALTGTFSLGARGLLIKKGQITRAFSEATLAGDFAEMLTTFTPSKEREHVGSMLVPSLRVENMTLAGT